jgi:hypothetical protein
MEARSADGPRECHIRRDKEVKVARAAEPAELRGEARSSWAPIMAQEDGRPRGQPGGDA